MPVDSDDPYNTSALNVIAVLPVPPVTCVLMASPPVDVITPLVVTLMPPPVVVAKIPLPVELVVTAPVLIVIAPIVEAARMPLLPLEETGEPAW